jgi:predicted nuclease of predicted toxin-antitoxin system
MKILLDENIPIRLKKFFSNHQVFTVNDKKWNGVKNGELLDLLISENFDCLVTLDKNLEFQQNFSKYNLPVIILKPQNIRIETLHGFADKIENLSKENLKAGVNIVE